MYFPTLWLSQSWTLLKFPALVLFYSSLLSDLALPYSQPRLQHYSSIIIHTIQCILQTLPLAMVFRLTNYHKFYSHELRSRCREIEQHEDIHEYWCNMAGSGTNHGRVFCYQVLQNCHSHDRLATFMFNGEKHKTWSLNFYHLCSTSNQRLSVPAYVIFRCP